MSQPDRAADTFTAAEVQMLHYAVRDLVARADLGIRPPLPVGFSDLNVRLASSVRGTKTCAPQPQSPPSKAEELIDSAQAAAILCCSDRWVRDPRFRDRLGGREIGGRWLYPRQTVVDHAQRKAGQHQ